MAAPPAKSDLRRIAELLLKHRVEFIVIGGAAETILGSPRVTYDVDLCYRRTAENLERLAAALRELKPTLRGAPPDLPFIIDARSLALGSNFTFDTPITALDLLGWVEPLGDYDALAKKARTVRVGDLDLCVIDLDDLIAIKQYISRPKDRESLLQLLAIRRIKQERDAGPRGDG
jgi:predicted nucleotidyltransferase